MSTKANESSQVKKYRKKLEQTIDKERKLMSKEAIEKTKNSIHKWILSHSKERINLKNKSISLFDENKHSAAPKSKFILKLASKLKTNQGKTTSPRTFKAKKI